MLSVHDLTVLWETSGRPTPVVEGINFAIERGHCLGLVGASGSGKTMIAMAIMQMLPPHALVSAASRIVFDGCDLLTLHSGAMRTYRGQKIAMIFQDPMSALNPVLTIGYQINEILRGAKNDVLALLKRVGLQDPARCYHAYPHELSGGMRQRSMIAMALAGCPTLIIADEVTTALDVTIQMQILMLLKKLQREEQLTLLFISHNSAMVAHIADTMAVVERGKIIEQGDVRHFFKKTVRCDRILSKAMPSKPLLQVEHLKVYFGSRPVVKAVDDVSLIIESAKTLALIGESGSGKTTLAKVLVHLQSITSGRIHWMGRNGSCRIQMLFQNSAAALNPRRSVGDSILEAILSVGHRMDVSVEGLLERVGIDPHRKTAYPHEFSGGEKQRVCIARALAVKPDLLILDEPTSALDASMQTRILTLLRELQEQDGMAYLLITHDFSVVSFLADRVAVMHQGRIVETSLTQQILNDPQHAYTRKLITNMQYLKGEIDDRVI